MYRSLISVGGFTLLSRLTGFIRDIVMASVMQPGPLSDAFFVAFRLPNHFRTIFGEGAYNAAFVPAYSALRAGSTDSANGFARSMLGWQVASQLVLLVAALVAMPLVVAVLAPGFVSQPAQMAMATELTRITFGYLFCVAVVTHLGGVLNAEGKFWAAAAAPILLNITMVFTLSMVFLFPTAAHAASWGVLISGIPQVLLVVIAAQRAGLPVMPGWPTLSPEVKTFFVRFWPAVVGAAGVQLAMFADTIFASFLGTGSYTSLYYADRIYQLPMGVIAIALGTVLLPEISRSVAAGDDAKTARTFRRSSELGLMLTLPCTAAFMVIPDVIMQGFFARGAFNVDAANAAGSVLLAYAAGLPAFVMLRTITPLFHARGDTRAPVVATGMAIGLNLLLKAFFIMQLHMGVEGLALATAIGTWINVSILGGMAIRRGFLTLEAPLLTSMARMAGAAAFAAVVAFLVQAPLAGLIHELPRFRNEALLMALGVVGLGSYAVSLLGLGWRR